MTAHPDSRDIYRHRWQDRNGYPPESKTETIVRLFRAELRCIEQGEPEIAASAKTERMRLLGRKNAN